MDLDVGTHDFGDGADGVADADLEVAAQVDDLAGTAVGVQGGQEAGDGVGDIVEVACRTQGAELEAALAVGDLGDDGRDHGAGRLARAIGVEGPQDGDRSAKGQVEG